MKSKNVITLAFVMFVVMISLAFMFLGCTVPVAVPEVPFVTPTPTPTPEIVGSFAQKNMKKEWSASLLREVRAQLANLNKGAKDMLRFCPNYDKMNIDQQSIVWAELARAIIKFESGCDGKCETGALFQSCSSMTESSGEESIGFFQLSYGNTFCPKTKAEGNLCDPDVNIKCAVKIMGMHVSNDGYVAAGGYVKYGAPSAKGLARYWSVIRVPDPKSHKNSKGLTVQSTHHLSDIMALTAKAPGCQ